MIAAIYARKSTAEDGKDADAKFVRPADREVQGLRQVEGLDGGGGARLCRRGHLGGGVSEAARASTSSWTRWTGARCRSVSWS